MSERIPASERTLIAVGVLLFLATAANVVASAHTAQVVERETTRLIQKQEESANNPTFEYDVTYVPDAEWDSQGAMMGAKGWTIVHARRAKDSGDDYGYELIIRRPKK